MRAELAALLTAALAMLLVACAPPGDRPKHTTDDAKARAIRGAATSSGQAATEVSADGDTGAVSGDPTGAPEFGPVPRAADGTAIARRVIYQQLRGGVCVPRCSECGETQPEGSEACAGCGQALVPWRHEAECPSCQGSGSCDRCGDDRPCLTCLASGKCADCAGTGSVADKRCAECRGRGACADCQGDGERSSALGDFAPRESYLTGICTTCVDGSGLCPTCATGVPGCLSCGGAGRCPDCEGTTACPWDRGDGLCAMCGGSGKEVVNGPPATPAERQWTARRVDGALLPGRVDGMPAPDFTVIVTKNGKTRPQTLVPSKVYPTSYYAAARDFTPLDDEQGREALATIAADHRLTALALRELARAAELEPGAAQRTTKRARELAAERAAGWMTSAREAQQVGDRALAALLFAMVPTGDRESESAVKVALDELREDVVREFAGLDDTARAQRDTALAERIARTEARFRSLTARARERLDLARDSSRGADRAERAFAAADAAVQRAERLVRADAHRAPPSAVPWQVEPALLLREARSLRADIASARAVEEIAGGRFELGLRLARIAQRLGADDAAVQGMLDAAERGMMRRGVRVTTPPPDED